MLKGQMTEKTLFYNFVVQSFLIGLSVIALEAEKYKVFAYYRTPTVP